MGEGNSIFGTDRKQEQIISYHTLSGLSYWVGFVGIWFIIGAVLALIGSVSVVILGGFALETITGSAGSLIGAIVAFVMGAKLRRAKHMLEDHIASGKATSLEEGLKCTKAFFKIQGILIILGIIVAVAAIIIAVFALNFMQGLFA